jgi:hypothetical protein
LEFKSISDYFSDNWKQYDREQCASSKWSFFQKAALEWEGKGEGGRVAILKILSERIFQYQYMFYFLERK